MTPRPYQSAALDALDAHLNTSATNPCVVLPTGAGKSPVIAWAIQRYKIAYPSFRCIVLAHVKELVAQNADKLKTIWPEAPVGIYAAGLRSRQTDQPITFASIDSVNKRALEFEPFDLIVVDEAHRIPMKGEGKYRRFIADCKLNNPAVRVVGMTATPYRLGVGDVCHADHILHEVCYDINVAELIRDGYLCPLRSKAGQSRPDLDGLKKRGGEYTNSSLSDATDRPELVAAAVNEAVPMLRDRNGIIFFCVDVDHCTHVSQELRRHGIDAPCLTGKTPTAERDRVTQRFVDGHLRAICNVNVLTEGFDATRADAIVLLRPTMSKGLYYQMVGRGLRTDDRKSDCLVLDFAGCIDRHGPIDQLEGDEVWLITCAECAEVFSRAVGKCPDPACGWEIPKQVIEDIEKAKAKRLLHGATASQRNIISTDGPETIQVDSVSVNRHSKPGSPDSLRVTYRCGLSTYREWVCLDHHGYAGTKARAWWRARFGDTAQSVSVDDAMQDIFLGNIIADMTDNITIKLSGKYHEIVRVGLSESLRTANYE